MGHIQESDLFKASYVDDVPVGADPYVGLFYLAFSSFRHSELDSESRGRCS